MKPLALCFIAVLCFPAAAALAGELDAAVTWDCRAKEGVFIINYYPSLGDAKPEVKKQHPLEFFSLCDVDKKESLITGTRGKDVICQFKKDKLEIHFEPGVPNTNLLGRCGATLTGVVTIKRNGKVMLEEKEFEAMDCTAREKYVEKITLKDGVEKPEIKYGNYEEE